MIISGVTCLLLGYFLGPDSLYGVGGFLLAIGLALRVAEAKYLSSDGRAHYCQCDPRQAVTDVVGTRLGAHVKCVHAGPGCPRFTQAHATTPSAVAPEHGRQQSRSAWRPRITLILRSRT